MVKEQISIVYLSSSYFPNTVPRLYRKFTTTVWSRFCVLSRIFHKHVDLVAYIKQTPQIRSEN